MAAVIDMSALSVTTSHGEFEADDSETVLAAMLSELFWFAVGFGMIRILIHLGFMPAVNLGFRIPIGTGSEKDSAAFKRRCAVKALCAAASAGQHAEVVKAWDREKSAPLPLDALTDSAQALAHVAPERLAADLAAHLALCGAAHPQPTSMNALVEAVVQSGRPDLAEELATAIQGELGVSANSRTHEILISGFASVNDEAKIQELEGKEQEGVNHREGRGYSMAIKGFLRSNNLDAAVQQMVTMQSRGLDVPPKAITELFKVACKLRPNEVQHLLDCLADRVQLPTECLALLLGDCLQREDLDLARRLEGLVCNGQTKPNFSIYESLLKLFAKVADPRALDIFERMHQDGFSVSEGLCGNLLARCGDSKNLRFADVIIAHLRSRSMMTLAIFKTLMKVYACCGLYDKACDLYEQVLAEGLEPDHVMYGCLTKFALKCGRTQLSKEVFDKCNGGDIQSYMCMIRAAGQDGKPDRAIELLRHLEASREVGLDVAVYNCAVDACVRNDRMDLARSLLSESSRKGLANLITYNTLIKGYGAKADLSRARRVFQEMESVGIQPDSASYNCLIASMVATGSLAQTLSVVEEMEQNGVPLDRFTVSIMMKVAKKTRNPRDANCALAVLDRASGIDVCEDEVLFNTVLDACCSRLDTQRLSKVLKVFDASNMKPSVHTYGLLIKAHSTLKQLACCQELWTEMVEKRAITPTNVTLSCMLDALTCARKVENAVALLTNWKAKVPANTVMYSTLIKGFAVIGEADRAMDMYRTLKAEGLEMNLVTYTALIDAHARAGGKMEDARRLFNQMESEGCEPNVITFSSMVKGYCMAGNVDEAFGLFNAMSHRGLEADVVMFNTLLDGCVRHSHFKLADELLAHMAKLAVQPSNVTLSIIVKMWGKRQQLDKAFDVVYSSLKDGSRRLDSHVGTCLMSACLHNNAPDRALELLAEMKGWRGCDGPDAGTFSTLVIGLSRRGDCRRAAEIAKEACRSAASAGKRPLSQESLQALAGALRRRGLGEELGASLAKELRAAGVEVPQALLHASAEEGRCSEPPASRRRAQQPRRAKAA